MSQTRISIWVAGVLVGLLSLWLWAAAEPLVRLARPGPWAGISGLIAYADRLYLVNSQIFVNHNSADIYSYHPRTHTLRFEHRLFSQDAGTPAIIDGLLYWPYEDPRFSSTHGEYERTDGRRWQWRVAPDLRGFHVHTMVSHRGAVYALASGWRGRLYRASDGGRHWEEVYEHPTPAGKISRLTVMVSGGNTLYLGLTAWAEDGVKLLQYKEGRVQPVPGWPRGRAIGPLTSFQGMMYAVNRTHRTSRLWRSDGRQAAQPVRALDGYAVSDLAATPTALWAVSDDAAGGRLWRSVDGVTWQVVQHFPTLPVAVAVIANQAFVGTYDRKRGGELWGPENPRPWRAATRRTPLPVPTVHRLTADALAHALRELDAILSDAGHDAYRDRLLSRLLPLALSRDPRVGQALSARLTHPLPATPVSLIGGQVRVPASRLAQWYLLYAIALNGHGRVPPALLTAPWTAVPNRAEKYLEPSLAAAWAVAQLRQSEPQTLEALRSTLKADLPDWARCDLQAALHRLAGRPFLCPPP